MNLIIQYGLLGLVLGLGLGLGLGFTLYCRIWRPWHYRTCSHSQIISVAVAGTGNSAHKFIFGVGTAPCKARTGTMRGDAGNEDSILPASFAMYVCKSPNQSLN